MYIWPQFWVIRYMIRYLFISLIFISQSVLIAQQREELTIGLFWNERPQTIIISVKDGAYRIVADNKREISLSKGDLFHISTSGSKIRVKNLDTDFGLFTKIEILEITDTSSLNIKSSKPKLANRVYEDDFIITSYGNRLKILNHAKLSNYVAGVIQWEAGTGRTLEYYKVQAIITRTYALKNINKFESEGFNLCDRVDSQVFKGRTNNKTIIQAVKETHDLVLVDENMHLISALFHSNSGGKTMNSEDVWSQPISYLRGIYDPYSFDQPHYRWTKIIPKEDWLFSFKNTLAVDVENTENQKVILSFCPTQKQISFLPNEHVTTTLVRSTFGLRSIDFCISDSGENIKITGKGFGHGVGLSQEGAIKMAEEGISFEKILLFYYTNVHLVQRSTMDYLESVD